MTGNIKPLISSCFLSPADGGVGVIALGRSNNVIEKATANIVSVSSFTAAPRGRLWEWHYSVELKSAPSRITSMRFIFNPGLNDSVASRR